jgi:hypothetical protein
METEKFFLMKYSDNWGDEMDIEGTFVVSESDKNTFQLALKGMKNEVVEVSFYIGSNEEMIYDEIEDFIASITFIEITPEDVATLIRLDMVSTGYAEQVFDLVFDWLNYN